jgi:hypothetical protein
MLLVNKLLSLNAAGTPPAGGSGASPRPPQTTTNEPVGQAAFSGRQTSRDEEVERWAVVLCNEVASASGRQDLYQRTYNFLSSCKQHMETREVRLLLLFAPALRCNVVLEYLQRGRCIKARVNLEGMRYGGYLPARTLFLLPSV